MSRLGVLNLRVRVGEVVDLRETLRRLEFVVEK
jgi:hypothetical protein